MAYLVETRIKFHASIHRESGFSISISERLSPYRLTLLQKGEKSCLQIQSAGDKRCFMRRHESKKVSGYILGTSVLGIEFRVT